MLIETPSGSALAEDRMFADAEPLPSEVEMILSSMEAGRYAYKQEHQGAPGQPLFEERRGAGRYAYHVRAELRLFRDRPGSAPWLIYVRDADPRGLGFVSPHRLPLGYGGFVELTAPTGRPLSVPCTLFRCREVVPGWYEGAMNFNREQADFKI